MKGMTKKSSETPRMPSGANAKATKPHSGFGTKGCGGDGGGNYGTKGVGGGGKGNFGTGL